MNYKSLSKQAIINSLEIIDGFSKKIYEYSTFTENKYFGRRVKERKYKLNLNLGPENMYQENIL
jgi:hypothetical protein